MTAVEFSVVFMGSPEFAVPALLALHSRYSVSGVVTQPDRPAGRGRTVTPPAVKLAALELKLPLIQPRRLREPEAMTQLRAWAPDLVIVAAFGQILRPEILGLPRFGCLNVHASLLPRWRGAAPIQAAILNGDDQAGVSIMLMDPGIDTGPVLDQREIPIGRDETAGEMAGRLADLGAELLLEILPAYLAGSIRPQPQEETLATYAPTLKKEDGELDFTRSAAELERRIRAFQPWPGAYTSWQGQILKVQRACAVDDSQLQESLAPGQRTVYRNQPAFRTGSGLLVLEELQPAGKKTMQGKAFLAGARGWA
jgi:methionyl-tRNA formyltransferase